MTQMKFRTKYDLNKRIRTFSPECSPIYERKGYTYIDGELKWVTKEKINRYAEIQAEKDAVELHAILERYENGDDTALDRVNGMYMDTVDLPSNYAELYAAVTRADDVFYSMPTEIREKYDNNAAMFWKNYGTEAFDDLVNAYRNDVFKQYGMVDTDPISTVKDFANDRSKVRKQFDDIDKKDMTLEVKNVEKSE